MIFPEAVPEGAVNRRRCLLSYAEQLLSTILAAMAPSLRVGMRALARTAILPDVKGPVGPPTAEHVEQGLARAVVRIPLRRALGAALLSFCLASPGSGAAGEPRPPCDAAPDPAHAPVGAPAAVRIWRAGELVAPWVPPGCLRWRTRGFAVLIAVSGRMAANDGHRRMIRRLTDTAGLSAVRYWSFTRKRWRPLFLEVVALEGPDPARRRADFTVDDIRAGRDYFLWQKENSLATGMIFRNRALEISENRLVLQQENVSPSYIAFLKVLGRRELETVAFIDRERGDVWRYYSLSRVGHDGETVADAGLASLVNRLVAGYRYLAGIPTDLEPPAAP